MKRILSTFLILVFGLGPLAVALPASAESRLPVCCRRHGAHHCATPGAMASISSQASLSSAHLLTAPSHCPNYPSSMAASTTPVYAMVAPAAGLPILLAQPHSPAASRAAALLSQIRTRAGRAPPSSLLG